MPASGAERVQTVTSRPHYVSRAGCDHSLMRQSSWLLAHLVTQARTHTHKHTIPTRMQLGDIVMNGYVMRRRGSLTPNHLLLLLFLLLSPTNSAAGPSGPQSVLHSTPPALAECQHDVAKIAADAARRSITSPARPAADAADSFMFVIKRGRLNVILEAVARKWNRWNSRLGRKWRRWDEVIGWRRGSRVARKSSDSACDYHFTGVSLCCDSAVDSEQLLPVGILPAIIAAHMHITTSSATLFSILSPSDDT